MWAFKQTPPSPRPEPEFQVNENLSKQPAGNKAAEEKSECVRVCVTKSDRERERSGVGNAQPHAVAALMKQSSYTQHPHTFSVLSQEQ